MTDPEFDRGPWIAQETDHGFMIVCASGGWLFDMHDGRTKNDKTSGLGFLESQEANAKLIAASPELYKALEVAELALINCIPIKPYSVDGPLAEIRRVMDKARGEA